ncbi:MAG: PTS sugar transporter subunit IIA [Candidatus Eisenbacteria bacterium]
MSAHEIMTVEEVAEYLRVSERTVYEWAQKGEIPSGKLGTSWRFKRGEIERWVNQRLTRGGRTASGHAFEIRDVLDPDRVVIIDETSKESALRLMTDVLARSPRIHDRTELARAIFERERLMSTGIGFGVAVPHVRLASVKELVMALGASRRDITDYESLDGKPVRIICMVAAGQNQHSEYLRALAAVSASLKDPAVRESVLTAKSEAAVFELLTK